ncbi:YgjV family protein [Pseudomonadota bacterium 24LQ007]|jgi:hypothetical protein
MYDNYCTLAGQVFGLISLVLCVLAFSSKQDERLFVLLLSANVAFALQFAFFGSWTAAALSLLVIARICLAHHYPRNISVMAAILVVSGLASVLTWQSWSDLPAIIAMILGTVGMFLLRGIPMRVCLGLAALSWMASHIIAGSVGGTLAEALVLVTNAITIYRMYITGKRYLDVVD